MSFEKTKRKNFRKKRQESSDEEEDVRPFTPRGYRTRPVPYARGRSGKQCDASYPDSPKKPVVLLVMDSNGRNIVNPQKVRPSTKASFELAAISIPGGKTFHARTELLHMEKCHSPVAHVVLALGTNDMSEGKQVLMNFQSRVQSLIKAAEYIYPYAEISYVSVIPRHDEFGSVVKRANEIIEELTEDFGINYLQINIPKDPFFYSDFIHLSDYGLKEYMAQFEEQVETLLFNNSSYERRDSSSDFSYSGAKGRSDYDVIKRQSYSGGALPQRRARDLSDLWCENFSTSRSLERNAHRSRDSSRDRSRRVHRSHKRENRRHTISSSGSSRIRKRDHDSSYDNRSMRNVFRSRSSSPDSSQDEKSDRDVTEHRRSHDRHEIESSTRRKRRFVEFPEENKSSLSTDIKNVIRRLQKNRDTNSGSSQDSQTDVSTLDLNKSSSNEDRGVGKSLYTSFSKRNSVSAHVENVAKQIQNNREKNERGFDASQESRCSVRLVEKYSDFEDDLPTLKKVVYMAPKDRVRSKTEGWYGTDSTDFTSRQSIELSPKRKVLKSGRDVKIDVTPAKRSKLVNTRKEGTSASESRASFLKCENPGTSTKESNSLIKNRKIIARNSGEMSENLKEENSPEQRSYSDSEGPSDRLIKNILTSHLRRPTSEQRETDRTEKSHSKRHVLKISGKTKSDQSTGKNVGKLTSRFNDKRKSPCERVRKKSIEDLYRSGGSVTTKKRDADVSLDWGSEKEDWTISDSENEESGSWRAGNRSMDNSSIQVDEDTLHMSWQDADSPGKEECFYQNQDDTIRVLKRKLSKERKFVEKPHSTSRIIEKDDEKRWKTGKMNENSGNTRFRDPEERKARNSEKNSDKSRKRRRTGKEALNNTWCVGQEYRTDGKRTREIESKHREMSYSSSSEDEVDSKIRRVVRKHEDQKKDRRFTEKLEKKLNLAEKSSSPSSSSEELSPIVHRKFSNGKIIPQRKSTKKSKKESKIQRKSLPSGFKM